MLAQALDYTYWDIETETQYKHTNCPSVHRELRAVTTFTGDCLTFWWLLLLWLMQRLIHGPCFDGCVLLLTMSVHLLPSILINYSVKWRANNRRNADQYWAIHITSSLYYLDRISSIVWNIMPARNSECRKLLLEIIDGFSSSQIWIFSMLFKILLRSRCFKKRDKMSHKALGREN